MGKKPDGVKMYPQEIQEILREGVERVDSDGEPEEHLYEMAVEPGESTYKMRLFTPAEYAEHWKDKALSTKVFAENGEVVGAQWNNSSPGAPPDSWDAEATYRPIYCQR